LTKNLQQKMEIVLAMSGKLSLFKFGVVH